MSDLTIPADTHLDAESEEIEDKAGREPEPDREPSRVRNRSSIIGALHAEVEAIEDEETKDLPVGRINGLYCRYRVLTREERREIERSARRRQVLRSKVSRDGADPGKFDEHQSALLLVTSCVELLCHDARGELVSLADALREEGVVGDELGALRYNAETVDLLDLRSLPKLNLPAEPSSIDVVTALHRWGDDVMPLLTNARALSMWMSGVTNETIEVVAGGM